MRASALPATLEPHPNLVTSADQYVLRGGSAIIGPDGRYIREPVFDAPTLLVADLDLGLTSEESMTLDVTGHYSRPDVFAFDMNPQRAGLPSRSPNP
jgi:predicted amidohydrolase